MNKEKKRKFHKKWINKESQKISSRKYHLKRNYGITVEEYNKILFDQNYCCALCRRNQTQFVRQLHVDHNHITGKIRGLLCHHCNTGLSCLEHDKTFFEKAKEYLDRYNNLTIIT
jgi:hypothetical protein